MDKGDKTDLYIELLKQVLDKSEETNTSVNGLRKDLDLHIQKTEFELKEIRQLDAKQNEILQEHHDRSTQLKRDNDLREQGLRIEIEKMDSRVVALEEPRKVIGTLIKWIVALGTVAAAVAGIYSLFK
jgi:hypothetical protein